MLLFTIILPERRVTQAQRMLTSCWALAAHEDVLAKGSGLTWGPVVVLCQLSGAGAHPMPLQSSCLENISGSYPRSAEARGLGEGNKTGQKETRLCSQEQKASDLAFL